MSGYDRYASDVLSPPDGEAARCPKCKRPGFAFDKALKAWCCVFCRYRDRR